MVLGKQFFNLALIVLGVLCVSSISPVSAESNSSIAPLPEITGEMAGSIVGNFAITQVGSATYNIPLAVPPGSAGMAPHLSLNYDSANRSGLVGPGWKLEGLSSISRCATTLAQDGYIDGVDFDVTDRVCLDGQRLVAVQGIYGGDGSEYRTESESFARIISYTQPGIGIASFVVYQKDGLIYEYGNSTNSRLVVQGQPNALAWQLNKVSDRSGNSIIITYQQDLIYGESLPLRIDYTQNTAAGVVPYNSVRFEYQPAPLQVTQYVGGSNFSILNRLSRIKMYTDNTEVWNYHLVYEEDPDIVTHELRLAKLEECAADQCLPPTIFSWGETTSQSNSYSTLPDVYDLSPAQGYANNNKAPFLVGDWNGDGKTDIARAYGKYIYPMVSNGNGFSTFPTTPAADGTSSGYLNFPLYHPALVGDWNGDGLIDLARVGVDKTIFYISTANGFNILTTVNDLAPSQGYDTIDTHPIFVGDWNGDGRTDIGRVGPNGQIVFMVSQNGGMAPFYTLADFTPTQGYNNADKWPLIIGDWNGDGLTDLARVHGNGIRFYFSTGTGFAHISDLADFGIFQGYTTNSKFPLITGDWNGDGKTDIARASGLSMHFYMSRGDGTFSNYGYLNDFTPGQGYTDINKFPILTGDWNSDGVSDIARVIGPGTRFYTLKGGNFYGPEDFAQFGTNEGYTNGNTYPIVVGDWNGDGFAEPGRVFGSGFRAGFHSWSLSTLLHKIVDGIGREIQVTYNPLSDGSVYSKGNGAIFPTIDLQGPLRVVSDVGTSNGLGDLSWNSYSYQKLRADLNGRGLSGFAQINSKDNQTGIITTTFYQQEFPKKALPYKKEVRLSNGILIKSLEDSWDTLSFANGTVFPYVTQSIEQIFEINGSLVKSNTTTRTLDTFGNPTQISVVRSDGSSELTNTLYNNDQSSWLVGQILQIEVTKVGGNSPPLTRTSIFSYLPSGLLQSETLEPGIPVLKTSKHYTYDLFGNVHQLIIEAAGAPPSTTITDYEERGRFPAKVTNALNHVEIREYDSRHGLISESISPNQFVTAFQFDNFGREHFVYNPDGTQTRTVYLQADSDAPVNAAYYTRVDASGLPPVITYFDELNREIEKITIGFDGRKIITDKVYDDEGRLTAVSEPYFEGEIPLWTVNQYDVLNRVVLAIAPGNRQTSATYNGLTTIAVDPLGHSISRTVDSQGRVTSVIDPLNGTLTFQYDSYGNPTKLIDAQGNSISNTYDLSGRKIQINDPDTGVSTYIYDALGQLLTQTNAKGEVIQSAYDPLGRVIKRQSFEGEERWIYDTAAYGIGKIAEIHGLNGYKEVMTYDQLGRLSQSTQVIDGSNYISGQSYDQYGRKKYLTYPSGFKLSQDYNAFGYLSEVNGVQTGISYWRAEARNARGQLEQERLGNSIVTHKSYAATTGLLENIKSETTTNTIQNLGFQFDAIGNLVHREDIRFGLSEDFSYDVLNRLTQSKVAGQPAVNVTYDKLGNILSRSDIGNYLYGNGAGPHAVTSIIGIKPNNYGYDAAGNRITSNDGTIAYNSSGRPINITKDEAQIKFAYEPGGNRISESIFKEGVLKEYKTYTGQLYERIIKNGGVQHLHYIRGGDGTIAIYIKEFRPSLSLATSVAASVTDDGMVPATIITTPTRSLHEQTKYLLRDHLGSIQTIVSAQGKILEVSSYDSWGRRRDPNTWGATDPAPSSQIERGFTGHEHLDAVSLIHMNGRLYDPLIGRFVSADPFVQAPQNMQSLNRYSYVLNNPLSFTDPSGFFLSGFFRAIGQLFSQVIHNIVPVVVAAVVANYATPIFGSALADTWLGSSMLCSTGYASIGGAIISGASSALGVMSASFATSAITGGDPLSSWKSGPIAFLRGFGAFGIGEAFSADGMLAGSVEQNFVGRVMAHGLSEGALSTMGGSTFGSGFISAAASTLTEQSGIVAASFIGGTASALGGGKFVNGAMQATIRHLFNADAHGVLNVWGYSPGMSSANCNTPYGCLSSLSRPSEQGGHLSLKELEHIGTWTSTTGAGIMSASLFLPPGANVVGFAIGEIVSHIGLGIELGVQLSGSTDIMGANMTNIEQGTEHKAVQLFGARVKGIIGVGFGGFKLLFGDNDD